MEKSAEKRLDVTVRADGDEASVAVSDTGHGLNDRTLETLQEPFHTTRRSGEGMGLGLAISGGIVKEHKGRMTAEQCPGGGALFTVYLPLTDSGGTGG